MPNRGQTGGRAADYRSAACTAGTRAQGAKCIDERRSVRQDPAAVSRSVSLHPRRFAVIGDLWDSPRTPIAVLESDRSYADVNDAFSELTGYTREEMLTMRAGELTVVSEAPVASLFEKLSRH